MLLGTYGIAKMGLLCSFLLGGGGVLASREQHLPRARSVQGRGLRICTLWTLRYALIFCNIFCESLFSDTSCLGLVVVDKLLGETVARLRCLLT